MHFYLFISVFITLSCHVGAQRRDQFSDHQRHILTRSAQWTVVTDVPSDGSIAFPISKPGRLRRPFPRIQVVSSTTKAPLPTELPSRVVIDNKIPVSLFRNKSFNNLEDFMKNLVLQNEYRAASLGSFVPSNTAGEAAITFLRANSAARTGGLAPPANCEPAETPVELERPEDPSLIYFPRCTKVQRCGGCCQHDLLMCVATRSEIINVNVMKARFIPDTNSFQPEGLHPIALEKHLNCECQCRVKAEDCNAIQEYREEECRCICTNENEAKECNGPNKFWDPQTCRCECRNSPDCSTGFFFDEHTCTCQPLRSNGIIFPSRRSGPSNRGHITYDVEKDEIEFLGEEKETTSHSPWFISNVMRANPVNHEEKDKN